jgi:H+-transporting ATPase
MKLPRQLQKDGPNAMPDTSAHPLRDVLIKFWAPVPWLLEFAIVLQLVLHKYLEAAVIAGLLDFQCSARVFSGRPRPGHARRVEASTCIERFRAP